MYDLLELARQTANIVCRGTARKYYRFRPARFYGGIATADCLGCNLRCAFCWAWEQLHQVHRLGNFYGPREVAQRLGAIAQKKGFSQVRISGNEPTLGMPHLLEVLSHLPEGLAFILETNGIILGAERKWAQELAAFPQVFTRVSLKGCTPEEFSRLTGARPDDFTYQLKALERLLAAGVDCHAAVMVSFWPPESRESLQQRLATIHPALGDFEEEELILYPAVTARLNKRGLSYVSGHFPRNLPAGHCYGLSTCPKGNTAKIGFDWRRGNIRHSSLDRTEVATLDNKSENHNNPGFHSSLGYVGECSLSTH